jgi:hypothetical protein
MTEWSAYDELMYLLDKAHNTWHYIDCPDCFFEVKLPNDRSKWDDQNRRDWAEISALAEQHGPIRTRDYNVGFD